MIFLFDSSFERAKLMITRIHNCLFRLLYTCSKVARVFLGQNAILRITSFTSAVLSYLVVTPSSNNKEFIKSSSVAR
jgi:hypothetical protein